MTAKEALALATTAPDGESLGVALAEVRKFIRYRALEGYTTASLGIEVMADMHLLSPKMIGGIVEALKADGFKAEYANYNLDISWR